MEDLEGADDATGVVGGETRGREGVDGGERGVKGVGAEKACTFVEGATEIGVGGGTAEEAGDEGFHVEEGPPDEEGVFAGTREAGEEGLCGGEVVGDGEGTVGGEEVEEMVRDEGTMSGVGLGGAEVHADVDGHGVEGEDFGVECGGDKKGETGFPGGGRTDEKEKRVIGHLRPPKEGQGTGRKGSSQRFSWLHRSRRKDRVRRGNV